MQIKFNYFFFIFKSFKSIDMLKRDKECALSFSLRLLLIVCSLSNVIADGEKLTGPHICTKKEE